MSELRIDILTLFPEMFGPVITTSIPGRATRAGVVRYHVHDLRKWAEKKHKKVDDRPFGGGPGMVMQCQPIFDACQAIEAEDSRPACRILLTPQGKRLNQPMVESLSRESRLLLIAGHYEGIDERVIEELKPMEISIGDYVLTGGELPAMILIDSIVRLLPGALGDEHSAEQDSFAAQGPNGTRLLEGPQYTRPRVWHGREVPAVLTEGDHGKVDRWRNEAMTQRTSTRRPDMLQGKDSS